MSGGPSMMAGQMQMTNLIPGGPSAQVIDQKELKAIQKIKERRIKDPYTLFPSLYTVKDESK